MARLSALGDALLTTGVMRFWAETRGMTFTVLTKSALVPVFQNHPAVTDIIGLEPEDLAPVKLGELAHRLSADHDGFLDLHANLRSRLMTLGWSGPVCRYPKFSLERRFFLLSRGHIGGASLKTYCVTQRYALALEKTPPPREELLPCLCLTEDERAAAALRLGRSRVDRDRPLVAFHPYATHVNKAWPAEYWKALGAILSSQGVDWLVVGRDNRPVDGLVAEGDTRFGDGLDFTNATSLRETAALLEQADLMVSGDSGPMHLACAVKTPVVALFGPTTAEWGFFPQGPRDTVLEPSDCACRPCSLHGNHLCRRQQACMRSITPQRVAEQVLRTLGL